MSQSSPKVYALALGHSLVVLLPQTLLLDETLLRVVQSLVRRCYFSYIPYLILVVLYLLLVVLCLVAGTHNIIIAMSLLMSVYRYNIYYIFIALSPGSSQLFNVVRRKTGVIRVGLKRFLDLRCRGRIVLWNTVYVATNMIH